MGIGYRSTGTIIMLLISTILLFSIFSIGASQINDSYININNTICSTGDNSNHRPFAYNTISSTVNCGWSTFTTNLRESITFVSAIVNIGFIYTIITRRKILLYISILWLAIQTIAMLIILGFDSNSVRLGSNYCNDIYSSTTTECAMMKYVSVCLLDAGSLVASALTVYIMFKWTTTWMEIEDGKDNTLLSDDAESNSSYAAPPIINDTQSDDPWRTKPNNNNAYA